MDLEKKFKEVKGQRYQIKLNMQKKFGILPDDMDSLDIVMSL